MLTIFNLYIMVLADNIYKMKWEYHVQAILTNSLFAARQNSPITSINTEFILSSWKEFADDFLLIGREEMIWILFWKGLCIPAEDVTF